MMDATEQRDDAELVAAVLAGDREAFNPLLERWQPSILRLCRRLLGPGPQAEDVAQEAAVAAFLGLPRLADPVRFGAWLQAIAANRARMALRRRHQRRSRSSTSGRTTPRTCKATQYPPSALRSSRPSNLKARRHHGQAASAARHLGVRWCWAAPNGESLARGGWDGGQ